MYKKITYGLGYTVAFATVLGAGLPAVAQDDAIEEIVITGSLIRGTPENSVLPVDQISTDDLDKQGAPPPLEMIKGLSYMNGIVGESNQFTAGRGQAAEGTASVNLRGFGATRTLVLLNGKRLASEDVNLIPSNAIARVEVLKDGGAVTYGSDAIGGVVNYITKDNVEGFEFSADYRAIDDSDGDYNIGATWGLATDKQDIFVAANYYHRSQLLIRDRDFALQPYSRNPEGGWSTGANPGSFRRPFNGVTQFFTAFIDPECENFGGIAVNPTTGVETPAGTQCRTRFTEWDNLVEEQDSYQFLAQHNIEFGSSTKLHTELMYSMTDVPHASTTPSYTTTRSVPSTVNPLAPSFTYDAARVPPGSYTFAVPGANPGLVAMQPNITGLNPGDNVYIVLNQWRPFFAGGNPMFGYEESYTTRERSQVRFATELTGELAGLNYTTSLSHSVFESERSEWDSSTGKLQLALRGLGGANCNSGLGTSAFTEGTAGVGDCMWFNPFSNASPGAPLNGYMNPNYSDSLANDPSLVSWIMDRHKAMSETTSTEVNFVLGGDLFELPGGQIGWATGLQYRHGGTEQDYNQVANSDLNPCPMTPINGSTTCNPTPESPYVFLATYRPYDIDREVKAIFGEMQFPVSDTVNIQFAARYEDYGDAGGDSFDPNLRIRWQATDWMAFRASAGTTFRAPPQTSLFPNESIGFRGVFGSNRPVAAVGNPDLEPEEAENYNIGVIFSTDNFDLNIDYWRFDIDKLLTTEPLQGILDIVFPNGALGPNNCATVSSQFLADHYDFTGGVCDVNNINKVTTYSINGAGLMNDGIDIQGLYSWGEVGPGVLSLGGSATRILHYETETLAINGVEFEAGFDGAGFYNSGTSLFPLPKWRGNLFLDYAMNDINLRWTAQYIDSYEDQRSIFASATDGQTIDSIITHNVTARMDFGDNITVSASIDNVTDEEPPFARTEINYDAVTHTPIGRSFKLGAKYRF